MRSIIFTVIASLVVFNLYSTASARNIWSYTCVLAPGSSPQQEIRQIAISSFLGNSNSTRISVSLLKKSADGSIYLYAVPAIYHHSSNVQQGYYRGFREYTPITSFDPPRLYTEKFKRIVISENRDGSQVSLGFPDSKNSNYICN